MSELEFELGPCVCEKHGCNLGWTIVVTTYVYVYLHDTAVNDVWFQKDGVTWHILHAEIVFIASNV